jgi:hypothetical protein
MHHAFRWENQFVFAVEFAVGAFQVKPEHEHDTPLLLKSNRNELFAIERPLPFPRQTKKY